MNLRAHITDRRVSAQICNPSDGALDGVLQCCNVICVSGIDNPAPVSGHLFRTPFLVGQISLPRGDLPELFTIRTGHEGRQAFAQIIASKRIHLFSLGFGVCVAPQSSNEQEGQAGCEQNGHLFYWQCAAGSPHAETRQPSRRSMVAVPVSSARLRLTATRCSARRLARLATCSIARTTRASADALTRRTPARPNRISSGSFETRNAYAHNTASEPLLRGGVLRSTEHKTRDCTCSTRS